MNPMCFATFLITATLVGPSSAKAAEPSPAPLVDSAAAQAVFDEWTSKGQAACEANEPACPRFGELLYNAAVGFQAAGQRNKAIVARTILADPRYHLDNTEIGKKALFQLAEDYKALTEYTRAADFYETAVRMTPKVSEAPDALVDATIFRLVVGDVDHAIKNVELYDKNYGSKKPARAVTLWMSIASSQIENLRFKEAKQVLERIMPRVDQVGELRDRFLAHAWLGGTLAKLDDTAGAEREYNVVRTMWKSAEIQRRFMTEAENNPRDLGKVLTAVGESLFFFAEQKRNAVDAIVYPAYTGSADKAKVIAHINSKVVDWIKKKRPAIEEAERAYRLIVELQPMPPPRWIVASASRVGMMWSKFVTDFRAAPIPREWKLHGPVPGSKNLTFDDLRNEYYARIDEAVEPQKQQAKAAYKLCLDYSAKFQYRDEYSRACQVWLEKHYNKEFVRVEEFIPAIRAPGPSLGPSPLLLDPRPSE